MESNGLRRSVQQASLREHNLALVLDLIAHAPAPPSRADVAHAAGLTRATAAGLVDRLVAARLVEELAPVVSGKAGRPATPLRLARRTVVGLGLEVNVDYVAVRAVDLAGTVVTEQVERADLRGSAADAVLADLAAQVGLVRRRVRRAGMRVAGSALAVPGLVDHPLGPLRLAPNLGWAEVDVEAVLRRHGVKLLAIDNEATLAARAELLAARAAGRSLSFIYVSGGVGVGAAIVAEGKVFDGLHGWAGEIGHVVVDPDGPPCSCGSTGCLEQYCGMAAVMTAAGLDIASDPRQLISAVESADAGPGRHRKPGGVVGGGVGGGGVGGVGDGDGAVSQGDAGGGRRRANQATALAARTALDGAARALGTALSSLVNLIDIPEIILGGELTQLADLLTPGIRAELDRRVLASRWMGPALTIRPASGGDLPALTGAALTCLDQVLADPAAYLPPEPAA